MITVFRLSTYSFKCKHIALAIVLCTIVTLQSVAEGLRICPSCGREDEVGVEKCPNCGHLLPTLPNVTPKTETEPDEKKEPTDFAKSVFNEVSLDIREARKCVETQPGRALAIYENALAMLAAQGIHYDKKAAATIADEIKQCKSAISAKCNTITAKRLSIQSGVKEASLYFKSSGRVPCGRVWIPAKWNEELTPAMISAIRQANAPVCQECAGIGYDACKKCNASGKEPCRHPGCKQGWVYEASQNDLSPKTSLKLRTKCPECNGTSFRKCSTCNGVGSIICSRCRGSGEAPVCTTCNGTGLVECRDCRRAKPGEICERCRGTHNELCRRCGGDGRVAR